MTPLAKNSLSQTAEKPSRLKRVLFSAIIASIPILLFLSLEIGLRMAHYDSDLDLVVQKEVNGQKVYAINRSVARRYFAYSGTVIPEPADNTFAIEKPKNTKRIFCLGESTMAGFPYEFNATAPSFLQDRLKGEFPQYNFEVINVGLSAISSYVVVDFMKDLVNYEPDLFIVYLGHNEFYGIYGSGSSIQVPGGYWITRLAISLLRFKTFLLMRDSYAWIKHKLFTAPDRIKGTLMEQMVGNQYILYKSPEYETTLKNYERNVNTIIDAAESIHIPVMFSSLVSNLRDAPPFHGMFTRSTRADSKSRWKSLIAQGDSLFRAKEYKFASESYKSCTQLDTMNATAFFKLGQAQYALGEYGSALRSFILARDRDGLRFRASEDFKRTLASACAEKGAVLAPTDSVFAANSDHEIIGNTLILEHLHPNIDGYFLMGKVFAETIRKNHLLLPSSMWDSARVVSDDFCRLVSGVTNFDYTLGTIKVSYLTHEWPFVSVDQGYTYPPTNEVESIVADYVHEKIIWSTARYDLAGYYAGVRNYSGARAECYAVSKVIPFSYQPLLRIADYYQMEGKRDSAAIAYKACYEREDNPYARVKLAVVLLEEENAAEASQQIEAAIALAMRKGITLTNKEQALSYYLLGVANAKLGKFELAREYANHSLVADPTFTEAKGLLSQLDSIRKR
jgi:tetratricopeptide (TPR) repeat protein